MDFMPVLTKHFLNMIQPNPFPEDLIGNFIVVYENVLKDLDTIRALLLYELGFLVCAVIGLLYMVLMPVIGGILACCRCSGNCGGRMYQRQTPRTDTCRRALYWSLFTTTSIVLLGNFFMFKSNASFKVSVEQINGTLNDLHAYFTAVPEQFDHMMNESFDKVSDEINNIGPKLGGEIQRSLDGVGPALDSIGMMANLSHDNVDLHNLDTHLRKLIEKANTDTFGFINRIRSAEKNLKKVLVDNECKDNSTCIALANAYQQQVVLYLGIFNFSYINQSLCNFQSAVEAVKWDTLLHEGNAYLNNIPQNVTSDIRNVVLPMKNNLKHTQTQIFQATRDHLVFVLTNVTDALPQLQGKISMIAPEVERADRITWAVGVVLCCMVLLVVVCNILGLVLGPLGLEPKADPIVRSSTAHCGGIALLFSAGFIFLFSWLLMGVVLMLFVPGGNMYALVCKPWNDGEQSKLIDTAGLIGFELGSMLGLNRNLTLTDVYSDCQKNRSLWSTLHMDEIINPEEGLNMSQYTDVILSSVNITPIILLSHVVDQIDKLHNVTINFTRFTEQINMIYSIDLNNMKRQLKDFDKGSVTTPAINDLIHYLGGAHSQLESLKEDISNNLNLTIEKLRSNVNETNRKVSNVLGIMGNAQEVINNCTTQPFIKTEHRASVDSQLDNVTVTYAECTNLTQQVARCGPVARAVDSVKNIICEDMLESLNTFWFSLGWCLIFFIPSIIFSIKLAKYYRRMEESDRYYKRMEEANRYDRRMNESDRAVESSVRHASSQNL